jgi:prolipoprotein diacylglyceryltransferase
LGFIFAQITMGQILSFIMFGVGFGLFIWSYRQRNSSIVDK